MECSTTQPYFVALARLTVKMFHSAASVAPSFRHYVPDSVAEIEQMGG